jgi:hypothetical protein
MLTALLTLQISNYKLMCFSHKKWKTSYNGIDYLSRCFDPHLKEIQMNNKFRFTMNVVTVLVVLALSAILAVPALADDGAPPAEAPVETAPPAEEPVAEPQAEEVAPEPVMTPEATTPEEQAVLPDEPSAAELIEQLPEGTEVVVLDENGEALPLASQEAAEAVQFQDPMWCPAGVTPHGAGCSIPYGSLEDLINDIINFPHNLLPSGNGVIWIQAPVVPGDPDASVNPIVIDGSLLVGAVSPFANMVNFSLTLKGGWSGGTNTTIDANNPSVFDVPISIINWNGNVTLSNIVIANTDSSVVGNDAALRIQTTKNIQLDNVTVEGNDNTDGGSVRHGASLENQSGTGTVVINNGAFNDNEGDGLIVNSAGIVTLNGLVAHNNDEDGAYINNTFALTDKAVIMKGFKNFSNNGGNGLEIKSDGVLTISNLMANNNGGTGAILNNSTSIGNLGVTLTGLNSFAGNDGAGLDILSHGNIAVSNVNALGNGGDGAVLDNCDGLNCSVLLAKTIKLTGLNNFSSNGLEGLEIRSFGSISLANLISIGNGGDGAFIDNAIANAILVDSVGTIGFTGYSIFNDNTGDGLEAKSNGNISMSNVTADGNTGGQGISITADKTGTGVANVTISGTNSFSGNADAGLEINADGKVTLYNVTANNNVNNGVHIVDPTASMSVILYGTNRISENGTDGLVIDSNGPITIYSLTANENGGHGAHLFNNVNLLKPYNVTLAGSNTFNLNDTHGLYVTTYGSMLISNLTANGNGGGAAFGSGAYLDNCSYNGSTCDVTVPKSITLSGYVRTSDNLDDGVYISSLGAVSLSNIIANGNNSNGVEVDNSYNPLVLQNITLKGNNFLNENTDSGLYVMSYGSISMSNLTANWNGENGAYLNNCDGSSPGFGCTALTVKGITLSGVNSFIGNQDNGLYFDATGSVSLARVTAEDNGSAAGEDGIKGYSGANITLTCSHTINNLFGSGYDLAAFATLSLKGFYSNFNALLDVGTGTTVSKTKPCALP